MPGLPSVPRYQEPKVLLNFALISGRLGSMSRPARELASASGYQVLACGAPAKSRWKDAGPAWPRTFVSSGAQSAWIWIGTVERIWVFQMSTAAWNAARASVVKPEL